MSPAHLTLRQHTRTWAGGGLTRQAATVLDLAGRHHVRWDRHASHHAGAWGRGPGGELLVLVQHGDEEGQAVPQKSGGIVDALCWVCKVPEGLQQCQAAISCNIGRTRPQPPDA